ncbi:hypothetical protein BDN70DRAFT_481503 [Pholiota conissans]|uniref:DUF6534 domain-containing protein n=1 Tax=Pholiota conissans TaxID=109636 RepID=A0A9P5Z770_9AGAR|nr:hypothetical protein BDN70DRAFT_481503 [Pholiota conissans]
MNWGLFGILTVQAYLYHQAFPNDRRILRAMVCAVYLLETAQTALLTETAWRALVVGVRRIVAPIGTMWISVCLIGGVVAIIVQMFYAYRILIFSERRIIPGLILFMSVISFVAAIVVAALAKHAGSLTSPEVHTIKTSTFIGIWAGSSAACDVLIAVCMCFYLSRRIRDGCFPKTQAVITRIIWMTIETGSVTAAGSILALVMYYPSSFGSFTYYGVPMSSLAKLYSNTMLAILNSRMKHVVITESTTWNYNELSVIDVSSSRGDVEVTRLRFAAGV